MSNLYFLEKYKHPKNIRFDSFYKSLSFAKSRNLKIFVETGTSRGINKLFFLNKFRGSAGKSPLPLYFVSKNEFFCNKLVNKK